MAITNSITCSFTHCSRVFLLQPPTLTGNAILLASFAILIPIALVLGAKYRSFGFAAAIATGLSLEVVGYIGRLLLHSHHNDRTDFVIFLVGTILGPTCICSGVFWTVPRIVAVYGEEYRSWRPFWYLPFFSVSTIGSLALELAGSIVATVQDAPGAVCISLGSLASYLLTSIKVETGIRVIVAGLAVQLVALLVFVLHGILFAITLRTRQHELDPKFAFVYTSTPYKSFIAAFTFTTFLISLRTGYRTVQVAEGFQSSIAQSEMLFLVLDGAVMLMASILLLIYFPARVLGQSWLDTPAGRLPQQSLRPIVHQVPTQPPVASPDPTYTRMSMKSSMSACSPRKANHSVPPPQREMVDRDDLW
ncbi:RTA1 like protein-domain-containing protein [Xylaria sp. FL0043]|nr:RTA1 like protein-domain-containing protein [Xylaria sp. FL0043]